ncbi:MAG: amidase [Planctomycetales bacterium]|nr:amidase [Planctomycetales bacterium]
MQSIAEIVTNVQRGAMDPGAVVDACLKQIERLEHNAADDAPSLQAWVEVYADEARESAAQLRERIARGGAAGPLAGVPIGVKDIFDVRGRPTRAASPLRENHCADCDAEVVARLRAADAIILGKTVTTQFACFDPPPTRNPWQQGRTPGGSSSGSAAAVATGMCLAALGSQTGGSITRPAAYCGVAGLKPAHGHLSLAGVVPVSFHLDHPGPMARTVADLAHVWFGLTGELSATADSEPRIALLQGDGEHDSLDAWTPDGGAEAFYDCLPRLGKLPVVQLPVDWRHVREEHLTIMAVEAAAYHRDDYQRDPAQFGTCIATLIERGLGTPAHRYADALEFRLRYRQTLRRLLSPWDALLTPAATGPAPTAESTGDPRFNAPWSMAGLPTVGLPCDWFEGLPIGVQLVSNRAETELLGTALWCERRLGFELPATQGPTHESN